HGTVGVLNVLGVLQYLPNPGVPGDPTHPPFVAQKLQLGNLGKLITSPSDLLKTLYDWGSPGFDGQKLLPVLSPSLDLLGLPAQIVGSGANSIVTCSLLTIKVNPATNPPGLAATVQYPISSGLDITLPLGSVWSVRVQA